MTLTHSLPLLQLALLMLLLLSCSDEFDASTKTNVVDAQGSGDALLSRFQGEDLCRDNGKVDKDLLPDADTTVYPPSKGDGSDVLVGVWYYPWHLDDFHNGQGYIRKDISQCPLLGEYDDSEKETIGWHLTWSRQANIKLWVMSWWGPGRREDLTIRNTILNHKELGDDMKLALFYETTGRVKRIEDDRRRMSQRKGEDGDGDGDEEKTLSELVRESRSMAWEMTNSTSSSSRPVRRRRLVEESNGFSLENVRSDMDYICKNYAEKSSNYLRIDDRPVLFMYLSRRYHQDGVLADIMAEIRNTKDCNFYVIGDHAFQRAPASTEGSGLELLDAITNYDVYGSFSAGALGAITTQQIIENHYSKQEEWKNLASQVGVGYVPSVTPGYNDMAVRPENTNPPLARIMLGEESSEGSLFKYSIGKAKKLVDPNVSNIMMVNSWNEWHEDTQIEPVIGVSPSNEPKELTFGVDYVAYGDTYLNILRDATSGGGGGGSGDSSSSSSNDPIEIPAAAGNEEEIGDESSLFCWWCDGDGA